MQDIKNKLIKKYKNRCDFIEIRYEELEVLDIGFNDDLESFSRQRDSGYAVRVINNGGIAFASIVDPEKLDTIIPELISISTELSAGKASLAPSNKLVKNAPLKVKLDARKMSIKEKRDIFKNFNKKIQKTEGITNSSSSYHEYFSKISYENSEGTKTYIEKMDLYGSISATAIKDGVRKSDQRTIGTSTDFNKLIDLGKDIETICEMAIKLVNAPKVEAGTYTVIIDQALGGVFVHEAFGHTSEADGIVDSKDKMKLMKKGTMIGSKKLTIYDTGEVPGSRGFLPFDDEGVRSEKTYLIENGKLTGHLHSRLTASVMGVESTGSARAISFKYPPIVRMRCTCIEGGDDKFEDMLKGIKKGLYCIRSNGGTGGEMFTFTTCYTYLIENGKITTLLRDGKLSGNLFTTLKKIDMVGNDFKIFEMGGGCGKGGQFPLPVAAGSPHLRIQDVVVGGA